MNLGIVMIVISVACLVAALAFGAPVWVNILGFAAGVIGLVLLGRGRRGGGG